MAKLYRVTLNDEERYTLELIIKNCQEASKRTKRSYALLAADENGEKKWADQEIKSCYKLSISTIGRLRKRFIEGGLQMALYGKKREIEYNRIFDGRVESQLVALRCSEVPSGHSGWSLRILAEKMVSLNYVESISHESVRQILKKTKLSLGR